MYRQITVHPLDRNLQRILWRYSAEELIQEYQLNSVTDGTASAPYLAKHCLKKFADGNRCHHPQSAQVLCNDFYVDYLLICTPTFEEAIHIQQELTLLLDTAGFTLRK